MSRSGAIPATLRWPPQPALQAVAPGQLHPECRCAGSWCATRPANSSPRPFCAPIKRLAWRISCPGSSDAGPSRFAEVRRHLGVAT